MLLSDCIALLALDSISKANAKKIEPCSYCNNASIDMDLDEDCDYSCSTLCKMPDRTRLMLCVGNGEPLRIEYETFDDVYGRWHTRATYYPKHCPNCGREITEYKE